MIRRRVQKTSRGTCKITKKGRIRYRKDDIDEGYNFGYNEPCFEAEREDAKSANNQWRDDIETHDHWDSESSKQESEESESEDDNLKKENRYNKNNFNRNNKEIIKRSNTNDLIKNDDNQYSARYNDDGINKTATYTSIINKPEMQGRADFTLHRTKNSSGYHFEAKTNYSNEYQLLNESKKDNINKRKIISKNNKTIEPIKKLTHTNNRHIL